MLRPFFSLGADHGAYRFICDFGGCVVYLLRIVVFSGLFAWAGVASAYAPLLQWVYTSWVDTSDAACQQRFGAGARTGTVTNQTDSTQNATCQLQSGGVWYTQTGSVWKIWHCYGSSNGPESWVSSTTNCATQPPPTCPAQGELALGPGYYDGGTSVTSPTIPTPACHNSCSVVLEGSFPLKRALVSGVYHYYGYGTYYYDNPLNNPCTGSAAPPVTSSVPPDSCPSGQVLGQFNGVNMCLAGGTPSNPYTPPPPSQTSTTTSTTPPDASGTTTTTITTTNPNGSTSTTIVNNYSNGTSSSTTTETPPPDQDPLKAFCVENPDAPICAKSSWGGSCSAFSCSGDAVQCAIAREQHTRNCALFDTSTSLSTLGNQVSSGADPAASSHPAAAGNRQVFSLPGSLDQSRLLAPGAGLTDQVFVVAGNDITVPFSRLNYYLNIMGGIVVMFSLIAAVKIVGVH